MAWGKVGTTTLGSTLDDIDITLSTSTKFLVHLYHGLQTGDVNAWLQYDGVDTGTAYAVRYNTDGAGEATSVSQSNGVAILYGNSSSTSITQFGITYICNIAGEEKLSMSWGMNQGAAGAGTAPDRRESVGKHAQTSTTIVSVDVHNTGAGGLLTDSNCSALGTN